MKRMMNKIVKTNSFCSLMVEVKRLNVIQRSSWLEFRVRRSRKLLQTFVSITLKLNRRCVTTKTWSREINDVGRMAKLKRSRWSKCGKFCSQSIQRIQGRYGICISMDCLLVSLSHMNHSSEITLKMPSWIRRVHENL